MENTQINDNSNEYLFKVYMTLSILLCFTIGFVYSLYSNQNVPIVNQGTRTSTNLVAS